MSVLRCREHTNAIWRRRATATDVAAAVALHGKRRDTPLSRRGIDANGATACDVAHADSLSPVTRRSDGAGERPPLRQQPACAIRHARLRPIIGIVIAWCRSWAALMRVGVSKMSPKREWIPGQLRGFQWSAEAPQVAEDQTLVARSRAPSPIWNHALREFDPRARHTAAVTGSLTERKTEPPVAYDVRSWRRFGGGFGDRRVHEVRATS